MIMVSFCSKKKLYKIQPISRMQDRFLKCVDLILDKRSIGHIAHLNNSSEVHEFLNPSLNIYIYIFILNSKRRSWGRLGATKLK